MNRLLALIALTLAAIASPALAATCADARPSWDGAPVTAWQEMVFLLATPPVLILLIASAFAVRFRSQWGALVITVLWTLIVTMVAILDPGGLRADLTAGGCAGSPTLFIALATAICVGMILYIVRPIGGPE